MTQKKIGAEFPATELSSRMELSDFFNLVASQLSGAKASKKQKWNPEDYPLLIGQAIYFVSYVGEAKVFYTKGFPELLGYDNDEVTVDLVTNYVHPDQKNMFDNVIKAAISYAIDEKVVFSSSGNLLLAFNCKKKTDVFIPVTRITGVYETDEQGRMISSFGVVSDATNIVHLNNLSWRLDGSPQMQELFEKHMIRQCQNIFTKKEIETLGFVQKGLLSKEIADHMLISKNTVDTHRKNMLKKSSCNNTVELLNFAVRIGVL